MKPSHNTSKMVMRNLPSLQSGYQTEKRQLSGLSQMFPSLSFYLRLAGVIWRAGRVAKAGRYNDERWVEDSFAVMELLESAGVQINISGVENLQHHDGPVLIVGNHMSMMETMVLPLIIRPIKPVTFIVKEALLSYPVFKYVMQSRNPIAVTRTNPRQDLKTVLNEGMARLQDNISIIVFPQTTRSHIFDASQMSSIGVKLAKKAGVPIVPVALKTDCWQNGRWFKDLGKLDTSKKVFFEFGTPLLITGRGDEEQTAINDFISAKLEEWEGI
ncbi:MAG: lysophospholipid acyltransferase family protein [Desulforhopalus sp.]